MPYTQRFCVYTCTFCIPAGDIGAHPESGSGSTGFGRSSEDRDMPSSQQGADIASAPEAGTRPDQDVSFGGSAFGAGSGGSGGGATERASGDYAATTGMQQTPTSESSPALVGGGVLPLLGMLGR